MKSEPASFSRFCLQNLEMESILNFSQTTGRLSIVSCTMFSIFPISMASMRNYLMMLQALVPILGPAPVQEALQVYVHLFFTLFL